MAFRNRLVRGTPGRPRRPMDWECGFIDEPLSVNSRVCKWLIPPSALREGYTDPTLMASMVWLQLVVSAAAPGDTVGFGIIVVSAFSDVDPFGDACPGPLTDCDADWAYLFLAPIALAGTTQAIPAVELDRRSSAKRRLGNDKAILLVGEVNGSAGAYIHAHVRCLIKE